MMKVIYHDTKVCSRPLKISSQLEKGAFGMWELSTRGVAAENQTSSAKSPLDRWILALTPLPMLAV